MSKAEKFIKDCTRKCSNEILSPYPQINNDIRKIDGESAKEFSSWLTPDQARRAVEIAREEVIAEVCEWIDVNYVRYLDVSAKGTLTANIRQFITDLKQAMKDE